MDIFEILFAKKLAYKEAKAESDKDLNSLIDRSITSIKNESVTRIGTNAFNSCISLTIADFAKVYYISPYSFYAARNFDTLIIRTNSVATLEGFSAFESTKFASGSTGGTLYVPRSLVASYQSANNWSTILGYPNNQIKAIEGSEYEI